MADPSKPEGAPETKGAFDLSAWPLWKKVAFVASVVALVGGFALQAYAAAKRRSEPPVVRAAGADGARLATGFAAGGRAGGASGESGAPASPPTAMETAAPILTQSGLSFFAAFCVGAALRAMAKALAIIFGVIFLAIFGLQAAGVIPPIDWTTADAWFRSAVQSLQVVAGKIEATMSHGLPSGTMAGLGLAAGLKRS